MSNFLESLQNHSEYVDECFVPALGQRVVVVVPHVCRRTAHKPCLLQLLTNQNRPYKALQGILGYCLKPLTGKQIIYM